MTDSTAGISTDRERLTTDQLANPQPQGDQQIAADPDVRQPDDDRAATERLSHNGDRDSSLAGYQTSTGSEAPTPDYGTSSGYPPAPEAEPTGSGYPSDPSASGYPSEASQGAAGTTASTIESAPAPTAPAGNTDPAAMSAANTDPAAMSAANTDPAATSVAGAPPAGGNGSPAQLLDSGELAGITRRWSDIQAAFVDSPQQAVQDADSLVADLMQHLAQMFATERQQLEGQWSRGGTVSTEDLRVALQRYRSFFQRLLSV